MFAGAGNVRSVRNAIQKLGFNIKDVSSFPSLFSLSLHFSLLLDVPCVWPLVARRIVILTKFSFLAIVQVESSRDIAEAECLVFPGVGAFGQAMDILQQRDYGKALKEYIEADRPFLGICLGLQLLFDGSEESGGCEGLGIIPGSIAHFDTSLGLPVPHIGWNTLTLK